MNKRPPLLITVSGRDLTFYEYFGVKEDCSAEDLKSAYKKKAREYHPDLNPGDKFAEGRFKVLQIVWDRLRTPEARRQYDYDLAASRPRPINMQSVDMQSLMSELLRSQAQAWQTREAQRRQKFEKIWEIFGR